MLDITKKVFAKFGYFQFLPGKNPDFEVLRLQLRKKQTLSEHEQQLLVTYLQNEMGSDCDISLDNNLLPQETVMILFRHIDQDKLSKLRDTLKDKIKIKFRGTPKAP